ncbi:MAG: hypothetical protein A3C27_01455 [Candidatus Levybacteria bacterium RIFCSPHIGHO2_02_FULL_39_36]|nr:MAG: hypothetical protein UT20_C0020G0008 [Candidatus Levybacteria bacterium GW2011_GWA1_39_11]KKR26497.1 MAG: hypothetical protein UT57_C0032G0010 [Microgenomates group bacterium GW2011_GWC1_39_7]KKR49324.1 MAG: hypothetical protein UT85_C0024G0008 [Candidatus Levybacteria bacterium GW2011_GWA2_40_16]OGH15084.1 MAG: hypothetical protein A2689_00300 [Candidatus Levybacteria bacterium RIFCSPHIGHO2_01_FULL_38_96]OGH25990.1 MAG: hypothetical protein A3E68_01440 [Candidatus Levybacteria bacteriu
MKIIVTHKACDLDAVVSAWLIKRFLPGWENANLQFVPAGEKLEGKYAKTGEEIEEIILPNGDRAEIIHVDTGLGKLDHHQTENTNVCATSLSFDYVKKHNESLMRDENKLEALRRIVEYVIDDDHFQEVFYENPTADLYDFSIIGLIHGIKLRFPKDDLACINFGMEMIEAVFHYFENKIWAEEEIKEKGIDFMTRWGKGIAIETLNDTVLKLAQTMGFVLAVRKDPATGSVRIKARPKKRNVILNEREGSFAKKDSSPKAQNDIFTDVDIDLTPVYEKLRRMDPEATWFLHASKRMLLNGSSKNPEMKGSKLTLSEVVEVLQNI